MTLAIPVWLLWVLAVVIGVPLVVAVLMFAYVGWKLLKDRGDGPWYRM